MNHDYLLQLAAIREIVEEYLNSGQPILTETSKTFARILRCYGATPALDSMFWGLENITTLSQSQQHVKISVTADCFSVDNPNKPNCLCVAADIVYKTEDPICVSRQIRLRNEPSLLEGYCKAIYFALTSLFNMKNNPGAPIEVIIDEFGPYSTIHSELQQENSTTQAVIDLKEFIDSLPDQVIISWRPKMTVSGLIRASKHLTENLPHSRLA